MSKKGEPVADLKTQPVVGVVYADPGSDTYVSVSGTAAMLEDTAKKEQLWNKAAEAWFPGGPTDPDLGLVQVQIIHADYWDVKESKPVQLFAMAKAVITGKPPQLGEHAEVRMGFRENIVGSGTDNGFDVLDRRVEFKIVPCR